MTRPLHRSSVRTPTRRRVVGGWALAGVLAVLAVVGLARALVLPVPDGSPLAPVVVDPDAPDPLRDEVACALDAGQEGEPREAAAGPLPPVTVSSADLVDCPQTFDGRLVRYVGEAVGALLERRDGTWAQLNDDAYGLEGAPLPTHRDFRGGNAGVGVLLPDDVAAAIGRLGGPGVHGDVLEVVGTFHRVDPATGEVAVIRADRGEVVAEGRVLDVPGNRARQVLAAIAAAIALAVVVVERRSRSRR